MAVRSIGLATIITAVTLAVSSPSGSTVVSRCETVTAGSAVVVRSECTASTAPSTPGAAREAAALVDVLGGMVTGLPDLADRVAQAIPAGQFGPWILLMHF